MNWFKFARATSRQVSPLAWAVTHSGRKMRSSKSYVPQRAALVALILATSALSQNIDSAPLIKNPPAEKFSGESLLVTLSPQAIYACPKGFTMFIKNVKPKQGPFMPDQNYNIFFPAPKQIINSVEGHEYRAICLKGF